MEKRRIEFYRNHRIWKLSVLAFGTFAAALVLTMRAAVAGVVLAPPLPPPAAPGPEENYPESSFGKQPTRPAGRSTMAAKAADEMDREVGYGNRRPAGLQFSDGVSVDETVAETGGSLSGGERSSRESRGLEPLTVRRRGVQEVSLIAGDLGFFPRVIFATRDVPVRLYVTGASKNTLCLMMDSFQVRRQVKSNRIEEISFTPGTAGKYRFYCPVNGMEGNLVVRELGSGEQIDDSVKQAQASPERQRQPASPVPAQATEAPNNNRHSIFE